MAENPLKDYLFEGRWPLPLEESIVIEELQRACNMREMISLRELVADLNRDSVYLLTLVFDSGFPLDYVTKLGHYIGLSIKVGDVLTIPISCACTSVLDFGGFAYHVLCPVEHRDTQRIWSNDWSNYGKSWRVRRTEKVVRRVVDENQKLQIVYEGEWIGDQQTNVQQL